MAELTLENFKKILNKELEKGFDNQALLINSAFQAQKDLLDEKFDAIDGRFSDMDGRFDTLEERLGIVETKLDRALYTELVYIETRLRKVEEKVGIKPVAKPAI